MNTYCGGDKGAMRTMVAAIERGEERDGELLERFGRMRAYLEKRDEQAGDWVFEVGLVSVSFFHQLLLPSLTTLFPLFSSSLVSQLFAPPSFMLDLSPKGVLTTS